HGRDGSPRWIVADMPAGEWTSAVATVAEEVRARGFIPIAVDVYQRLRPMLADDLSERGLVLLARPGVPLERARSTLIAASAHSPRPHVLLTFRAPDPRSGPKTRSGDASIVAARSESHPGEC